MTTSDTDHERAVVEDENEDNGAGGGGGAESALDKPLGLKLHAVVKYLQQELRPVSSAEIAAACGRGVNLAADAELRANLEVNPKVLREPDGRWRWRSKYYLRNRDDLLALLRRCETGVIASELYDSYKSARQDIHELAFETRPPQLLLYRATDNSKDGVLFANDASLHPLINEDVRKLWHATPMPDALVVHNYLVQHGLKEAAGAGDARAVMAPRKRPRSKRPDGRRGGNRRIRLTNVHLEGTGIDLSRDYTAPRERDDSQQQQQQQQRRYYY